MNRQTSLRSKTIFFIAALVLIVIASHAPTVFPVSAQGAQDVRVVNFEKEAVPVFDVENPARQAFQTDLTVLMREGISSDDAGMMVPAGKRLVIEYVSGRAELPAGQFLNTVALSTHVSSSQVVHYVQPTLLGANPTDAFFSIGQLVKIYADPGIEVHFILRRSSSTGSASARVSLSGYLVDLR